MPKQVRVFYAYPNEPPNVGETIASAIDSLKSSGELKKKNLRFKAWTDNSVAGKPLIGAITNQLDRHHIFACDLTYPNHNVNFELGYAIAKFKRIFTSINPSISNAQSDYKRFYSSWLHMGYSEYTNYEELANAISVDKPWENLEQTLLESRHQRPLPRLEKPTLMYIKPPVSSDSVIAVQEEFKQTLFRDSIIVDDPNEYSSQILEWYVEKLQLADVVAIHLLSTQHSNSKFHNLKASTIAGLAHGFGRPLIMLAHSPYDPPVDYHKLMQISSTAEACVAGARSWLVEVSGDLSHRPTRRPKVQASSSAKLDLRSLFLGDVVAEHEADQLHNYFVETSTFYQAMDDPLTILVGRRGTGKTAILYAIQSEVSSSTRSHVTVLKPVGYETHGLIRILEELQHHSERGFLIESLWKYLVYSEFATDVSRKLIDRPLYQQPSPEEQAFLDYYEHNSAIFAQPFSQRLESAILSLQGLGTIATSQGQRVKISEHLHNSLISELRRHLGIVLTDYDNLTLLIDGLDDPWIPGEHITHLAELIAGLLGVVQYIPMDFRRSSSRVNLLTQRSQCSCVATFLHLYNT